MSIRDFTSRPYTYNVLQNGVIGGILLIGILLTYNSHPLWLNIILEVLAVLTILTFFVYLILNSKRANTFKIKTENGTPTTLIGFNGEIPIQDITEIYYLTEGTPSNGQKRDAFYFYSGNKYGSLNLVLGYDDFIWNDNALTLFIDLINLTNVPATEKEITPGKREYSRIISTKKSISKETAISTLKEYASNADLNEYADYIKQVKKKANQKPASES